MNFSPTMLARIKDLLASPMVANQQLALTLIEAHGLPEIFRDELLVEYLNGNNRPRVTIGIKIAKALGPEFLHEALWFRYLAIGTVGTSYGWVKSFLEVQVQEKAYNTFKQFGYPASGDLAGDLQKLQALLPELNTQRLALLMCLSSRNDKEGMLNTKIWSAFSYLVRLGANALYKRCLEAMIRQDSLTLAFLNHLPQELAEMKELKKLTFYGQGENSVNTFPKILLEMPQLTELRIMVHGITEIPDEIDRLQDLRILDFTFNPIDYLPQTILNLPRLFVLAVTEPLLTPRGKACLEQIKANKGPELRIVLKTND
jgi:hypothetical protein